MDPSINSRTENRASFRPCSRPYSSRTVDLVEDRPPSSGALRDPGGTERDVFGKARRRPGVCLRLFHGSKTSQQDSLAAN
ncbi:RIIa domain-containing protein 1 isoform X3 [Pteropus vampyrus]|uniref:RIIa domain-containing protein 1 isoform X3 n=1 Tax=Pteropus vampyrus TaxID=132908 RepID=A0A6P6BRH5_PTEVA|nr:RIIa domain-containing protein 1 isoform X3 [Pteropus vampyrus]